MATLVVTTNDPLGGSGLSLAEAILQAQASSEDDIITFDHKYVDAGTGGQSGSSGNIVIASTIEITGAGGAITIDGDINHDGISDVMIDGEYGAGALFKILGGADVTFKNVDFTGGYDKKTTRSSDDPDYYAQAGAGGQQGTAAADGVPGSGTMDGADGDNSATGGGNGQDGAKGDSAAGAIINYGNLTLIRSGFGGNVADAQDGQHGGFGGAGGFGANGGDGATDKQELDAAIAGGDGGDGGRGGDGGDGGRGGDGGDAASTILNMNGATLTLVDSVFGGRLTSGYLSYGNRAEAGDGGEGGQGGEGGSGGAGGRGGDFGSVLIEEGRAYDVNGDGNDDLWLDIFGSSNSGLGGNGGQGGDGGDAGRSGDGGDAAPIVNFGAIDGNAAITGAATSYFTDFDFRNLSNAGRGDKYSITGPGSAGLAGTPGEGGFLAPTYSYLGTTYTGWRMGEHWNLDDFDPSDPVGAIIRANFSDVYASNFYDYPEWSAGDPQAASGSAGSAGADGGGDANGDAGTSSATIVFKSGSTGAVTSETGLIYLYDMGQKNGQLTFNIIRIGDASDTVTVGWRVVGNGGNAVDAADFGGPTTGTATLDGVDLSGAAPVGGVPTSDNRTYDNSANVVTVTLDLVQDDGTEGDEGYRIELYNLTGNGLLGTSQLSGLVNDENIVPVDGPTNGDDILNGTSGRDVIKAKGGDDTVRGKGGNDKLFGENGRDKLFGDGGNDVLKGGAGKDKLYGSSGKDKLYGEDSADILDGGSGIDRLTGGKGNDSLKGGGGKDIFVFGKNDGRDTIQDFQNQKDRIDLKAFKFSSKNQALKHFAELGTKNDDKVKFDFKGTEIKINGVDLKQIDAHDIII